MDLTEDKKSNIVCSLNEIKKDSELIDYIEFKKTECKIIGHQYKYEKEYEYDKYIGSVEVGENIVPFRDDNSSYFFNTYVLDRIDDFAFNIKDIISKRYYCEAIFDKILTCLNSLNKVLLSSERIAFDIPNKKLRYHVGSDFEPDEQNGIFVFHAEECLEQSCFEEDDGSLYFDVNINEKAVERFSINSIESFYKMDLYYCDEDFIVIGY